MQIAGYTIESVVLGTFRLDGGAMFGAVPKNLWQKLIPVDEENCIPLATRSLVLTSNDRKILIDVGNGEKWNDKLRKIFAIQNTPASELGFSADEITDVILTHLHFDHAGGISYLDDQQNLKLTYPNATIWLQRANFDNASNPSVREKASYLKENVEILKEAKLELLDGDGEFLPDISAIRVDGHTVGQQVLKIADNSQALYFLTDLCPTSRHLPVPYNMGYDVCTTTVLEEKERVLSAALSENATLVFEHDPDTAAGKIERNQKGHFVLKEKVEL